MTPVLANRMLRFVRTWGEANEANLLPKSVTKPNVMGQQRAVRVALDTLGIPLVPYVVQSGCVCCETTG